LQASVLSMWKGVKTLRTQDISALSDWCRTVSTSIHICRTAVYLIYTETPRQREPRDAATDAETRTISDSIDRSLTLINA